MTPVVSPPDPQVHQNVTVLFHYVDHVESDTGFTDTGYLVKSGGSWGATNLTGSRTGMKGNGHKNGTVSGVIPALNEHEGIVRTIKAVPRDKLKNWARVTWPGRRGRRWSTGRGAATAMPTGWIRRRQGRYHSHGRYRPPPVRRKTSPASSESLMGRSWTSSQPTGSRGGVKAPRHGAIGWATRFLTFATRLHFGVNLKDSQSGMWMFRRRNLDNIALKSNEIRDA